VKNSDLHELVNNVVKKHLLAENPFKTVNLQNSHCSFGLELNIFAWQFIEMRNLLVIII